MGTDPARATRATRSTPQRGAVREALGAADGFASAQDVYAALRSDGAAVGLSTVYRHLQNLVEDGAVDVIHTADGEATYRLCGDTGHHHHLVCRKCGRAVDVEGRAVERWAAETAAQHGYTAVEHTVELFGLCPQCSAAAADAGTGAGGTGSSGTVAGG